ncbi:putative ferric-chelate reductase 1 [Acropora cervicornis]|uniref:Ferric-chelate reductase 1 n=1 Tax=Acropora cervicornis TaxID=6130 RepID=A0AAD9UXK8_ACRCE|nr:putative ferric-chelate reductase 1 [Acropora cervicornis]
MPDDFEVEINTATRKRKAPEADKTKKPKWKSGEIETLIDELEKQSCLWDFFDGRCKDQRLSGKTGSLQTPNYPDSYPSHSRCSWHVQVPVGYKIKLQFYHFLLEKTYMCTGDVLKIYDGTSHSAEPLGTYCGAINPFRVESTASNLFLDFKSDRSLNYAGFNATFSAVAIHLARPMTFARTLLNSSAGLGNNFQLLCHIKDGSANLRFSWTKNGVKMGKNGARYNIESDLGSKISYLFLSNVSQSDSGVYGCFARDFDLKKNISAYGTLVVKVPAVVDEGPSAVNVNVGNQVLLKCRSSGDPVPKMSWQVNGKPMKGTQTKFNSELKIKAMEDAVVNCSADNGFGMDWRTAKVTVHYGDITGKPTIHPKTSKDLVRSTEVETLDAEAVNSKKIKAHGSLMVIAWIGFASVGIFMARYMKGAFHEKELLGTKIWFTFHRSLLFLTVLFTLVSMVVIFYEGHWSAGAGAHAYIGIVVFVLSVIQPFMALMRPNPGAERRYIFDWAHRGVGLTCFFMAVMNVFLGIRVSGANLDDTPLYIMIVYAVGVAGVIVFSEYLSLKNGDRVAYVAASKDVEVTVEYIASCTDKFIGEAMIFGGCLFRVPVQFTGYHLKLRQLIIIDVWDSIASRMLVFGFLVILVFSAVVALVVLIAIAGNGRSPGSR